ncbi:hypothetical protein ES319_A03G095000v1 [Gossypium barbadense]|uniref:Uncharacterized protein n=2 Tax=Gossypium TaxID=3633 RepID=A0A2P5WMA7_GOSBA|nr:hypothetical protein ES319_A03G095000v1 [Gossypium barbadense]PPR92217.1 hypothetical protein GOBAR_AA28456 [Gossypium barbadense]TYH24616.1 hypothetical protein ES288_A03G105600v1 [Gossypium darwinii]
MLAASLVRKIITQFASIQNLGYYKPTTVVIPMAPRRIDHVASKPEMWKHLKARVEAKRLKVEMGKVREDQECLRVEQRNLITRFGEIERQYDELKQEAEMIAKQSALARIKQGLMLGILIARDGGHLVQTAILTRFLVEIVAMEKASAILADVEDEEDP